jgi:hypothetical protein
MNQREKVFANRNLSDYEIEMIGLVFEQNDLDKHLDDGYIYIYLEDDGEIDIMKYPDEIVKKTMEDYFLTARQSIEYLYDKDLIDQEVAELLYWSDIDEYKKYVPVIRHSFDGKKDVIEYADYYLFARDDYEAAEFMSRNAYFDYLYLENVDAD